MAKTKETNSADLTERETAPELSEAGNETPKKSKKPDGGMYSAADIANAARKQFGVAPEVAKAALKFAKKDKATTNVEQRFTLEEAKGIIKKFLERSVK